MTNRSLGRVRMPVALAAGLLVVIGLLSLASPVAAKAHKPPRFSGAAAAPVPISGNLYCGVSGNVTVAGWGWGPVSSVQVQANLTNCDEVDGVGKTVTNGVLTLSGGGTDLDGLPGIYYSYSSCNPPQLEWLPSSPIKIVWYHKTKVVGTTSITGMSLAIGSILEAAGGDRMFAFSDDQGGDYWTTFAHPQSAVTVQGSAFYGASDIDGGAFNPGAISGPNPVSWSPNNCGPGNTTIPINGPSSPYAFSILDTTALPTVQTCSVPAGSTIYVGDTISCSFTSASGTQFEGWGATGFTYPVGSTATTESFTAATTGKASITMAWFQSAATVSNPTDVPYQSTIKFTIKPSTKLASCNPGSGNSISWGATVSCKWKSPPDATFLRWSSQDFNPTYSTGTIKSFLAVQPGSGSITVEWSDAQSVINQETFSYTISLPASVAACTPKPPGTSSSGVTPGATVTCVFKNAPGTSFISWGANGFTPTTGNSSTATFTANQYGQFIGNSPYIRLFFYSTQLNADIQVTFTYKIY